jgi:hypothetical protein
MAEHIPRELAAQVRNRAAGVCEYCQLPQACQEAAFHIDHVVPRSAGGETTLENLALACVTCSLRKAARTAARDPRSGSMVALFHPRRDRWHDHFRWMRGWRFSGRTPTGRATIRALGMNRPAIIAVRRLLARLGELNSPQSNA